MLHKNTTALNSTKVLDEDGEEIGAIVLDSRQTPALLQQGETAKRLPLSWPLSSNSASLPSISLLFIADDRSQRATIAAE